MTIVTHSTHRSLDIDISRHTELAHVLNQLTGYMLEVVTMALDEGASPLSAIVSELSVPFCVHIDKA